MICKVDKHTITLVLLTKVISGPILFTYYSECSLSKKIPTNCNFDFFQLYLMFTNIENTQTISDNIILTKIYNVTLSMCYILSLFLNLSEVFKAFLAQFFLRNYVLNNQYFWYRYPAKMKWNCRILWYIMQDSSHDFILYVNFFIFL